MASRQYRFSGKSKWAMVYVPDPEYKAYQINVYLDQPSWETFRESGCQAIPKNDEQGQWIKLRRQNIKEINGKLVEFGQPKVFDAEGKPTNVLIGNGSEVECLVTVYDTRRGKGTRLEEVHIKTLVPYEKKEEVTETAKAETGAVPF